MNIQIIIVFISLLGGFLMGYLTSYIKEKGKNKALIQDLERMTEEKEKVSSKYQLDISKRKYKYEDKRNQYFKYFNLLDSFTADSQKIAQENFMPAMHKFNDKFLRANGNKKIELKATADFANSINQIMMKANESLIKLKQETNSINLIAGPKVSQTLQELEQAYNNSMNQSAEIMKDYSNNVIYRRTDVLKTQQLEMEKTGRSLQFLKDKLLQEIKDELDEI